MFRFNESPLLVRVVAFCIKMHKNAKKVRKNLHISNKSSTFAPSKQITRADDRQKCGFYFIRWCSNTHSIGTPCEGCNGLANPRKWF